MIGGYLDTDGISGGERVRLCNPCVPDPNTAPPQSPTPLSPRTAHSRSRSSVSSVSSVYDGVQASGRYGGLVGALQAVNDTQPYHGSRTQSIALVSNILEDRFFGKVVSLTVVAESCLEASRPCANIEPQRIIPDTV